MHGAFLGTCKCPRSHPRSQGTAACWDCHQNWHGHFATDQGASHHPMFLVFFMCVCPEIGYIMVYRCFYRAYHNILKIAFYSGKCFFESLDLGTIRHRSCPWTKRHNIVRFFSTEPTAKCWENRKTQYASYDWDMGKHTGNHKSTTELFS